MTISVDGARSRRRTYDAIRKIRIISSMGIPAISGFKDGFAIKVWQMNNGEISGGTISAPYGIFVALSDDNGIRHFVYDSSSCAALPVFIPLDKDRYVLSEDPAGADDLVIGGDTNAVTVKTAPMLETWERPAQPASIPFGGEYVVLNVCFKQTFSTLGKFLMASQLTHCDSNGVGDKKLLSVTRYWEIEPPTDFGLSSTPAKRVPLATAPGFFEFLEWKAGPLFTGAGGYTVMASYIYLYAPTGIVGGFNIQIVDFLGFAPAYFLAKLSNPIQTVFTRQMSSFYRRTATDLIGVHAVYLPIVASDGTEAQYDDPSSPYVRSPERIYRLGLYFYTLTGTSVVAYDVLESILLELASHELEWVPVFNLEFAPSTDPIGDAIRYTDFLVALRVLSVLFGWPAESDETAEVYLYPTGIPSIDKTVGVVRDTVTFSNAAGEVYSWLRATDPAATQGEEGSLFAGTRLGGFKFDPVSGIIRASLVVPTAVLVDITLRPRIMLLTETTYVCIADKANGEIHGLFIGSPFSTWDTISLPVGVTMYNIRAILAGDTVGTSGFVGVGKEEVLGVTTYYSYMKMKTNNWVRLGSIPAGTIADATTRWDVCVFGDDGVVGKSMDVQQFPVASAARHNLL